VTLLASVGFASVNIADTTAARTRVADQSVGLAQRVAQMRSERAAIFEFRAVASIEAEIQRASRAFPRTRGRIPSGAMMSPCPTAPEPATRSCGSGRRSDRHTVAMRSMSSFPRRAGGLRTCRRWVWPTPVLQSLAGDPLKDVVECDVRAPSCAVRLAAQGERAGAGLLGGLAQPGDERCGALPQAAGTGGLCQRRKCSLH
jgi:hypothetical protein